MLGPWTRVINGRAHCTLRVSGRIMELDDEGHRAVIAESIEKAAEWYRKELVKVQDEQYHERIRKHLEKIRPRTRRRHEPANN